MHTTHEAFQAELDRLLTAGLTPQEEEIARRYYSQKERDALEPSSFCGPHQSFPITSQEDVNSAAHLVGHADDPAAVRACIIKKAHAHGWSLPDAWQEDKACAEAEPALSREAEEIPPPCDEETPQETEVTRLPQAEAFETTIFAPVVRWDKTKREVVVRATAEDLDSYQTVIGFEASKAAFTKWRGNIREMHDSNKAVGRAIKWEPHEEEKAIDLTLRISKGAEDTWQKVLDGTLSGASIGARNGKWDKRTWGGKEVPYLTNYDLVEVSLVDNPSCPGCDIKLVRSAETPDALLATDVLDFSEENPIELHDGVDIAPSVREAIERKGARLATKTLTSLHKSRDLALQGVQEMLSNCGCAECDAARAILDPDGDGDIDIFDAPDTDDDAQGEATGAGSGIAKAVAAEITRQLGPVVTRMSAIASRLVSIPTSDPETQTHQNAEITRRMDDLAHFIHEAQPDLTKRIEQLEQHVSKINEIDEVRSVLAEVKDLSVRTATLAERIAAQPAPGGPIVNSSAMRMVLDAEQSPEQDALVLEEQILTRLARSGILNKDQQINAALHLQRLKAGQAAASARR